MMKARIKNTFRVLLVVAMALLMEIGLLDIAYADGISQEVIRKSKNALGPAVCLLSYSSEITNPSSGETNKRKRNSLGVLVSDDGLIMAHGHMLQDNRKPLNIKVTIGEGEGQQKYDAVILKKPDDINVCFLRIETDDDVTFPFVKFEAEPSILLGEPLFIFGVMGVSFDFTQLIQSRRIGAVLEEPRTTYVLDQSITFGFIGGPVVNASGQVIGVLGFDLSTNEGGDIYTRSGHPLVFQPELFLDYIENPPTEETLNADREDAWLGVFTQPLTENLAEYWNLPNEGGIVVATVLADSSARAAGILEGDIIVDFNGVPVTATQDKDVAAFTKMVRESPIEEELSVTLYRNGVLQTIRLTLMSRPKTARDAEEFEDTTFGLTVRELTRDVRIVLNLSDDIEGVIVRRVKSGSSASLAGIRPSYILLRFGDHPVRNLEEFELAVTAVTEETPDEVTVFCRVGATTAFFRLQPRWND